MIFGRMVLMETTHKNTVYSFKGRGTVLREIRFHEFQKICRNKARKQERLKSKKRMGLIKQIPLGDRD